MSELAAKDTELGAGRLRCLCLALAAAEEVGMERGPTYRIGGKIFACDRLVEGAATLWCKAPEGGQAHLIAADPARFFSPPYFGAKGWIGMRLEGADWGEVERLVKRSYALVAKKGRADGGRGRP